jgi:hypothetical protein
VGACVPDWELLGYTPAVFVAKSAETIERKGDALRSCVRRVKERRFFLREAVEAMGGYTHPGVIQMVIKRKELLKGQNGSL